MRSDNDQTQLQYQQYNTNVQRHIQELNEQIKQLVQTNSLLENEQEAIKQSYEMKISELQNTQTVHNDTTNNDFILERDALLQENQLFKQAIDEWSRRFEETRLENEQIIKHLNNKDEYIFQLEKSNGKVQENMVDHEKLLQATHEDKTTLSRAIAQNKQLKEQLTELQDGFVKMSNDNMNLTNQIQATDYLNKQLNERLAQKELQVQHVQTTDNVQNHEQSQIVDNTEQGTTTQQMNDLLAENKSLRERLSQLEQQSPVKNDTQN
ncbi:unnamed protein product, partial [Adineta steineri]